MGGNIDLPFGLATSVGPVPCDEPEAAVRMALQAQPQFPCVPTLGTNDGSLLAQAVDGIDGVDVLPPGLLRVAPELPRAGVAPVVTGGVGVDGEAYTTFRAFVAQLAEHPGIGVRVGLLGPVTVALALRGAGVPTEAAVELAEQVVARRASAMLGAVRAVVPDRVVMVVASEPGMIGAVHPTFPLTPTQVLESLTPFVDALDQHPAAGDLLIGVHVPGRTDWETIIASGVSVVSAPVDHGLVGWASVLSDFMDRGGRVVWGAVPVDQPLGTSEELLWRRLSAMWCELVAEGMDPLLLRSRSLVGPVDGLGHFGVSQAERVLDLVDSLSTRVRRQAIGARLTLGA
jgi:hypothetical protein